MPDDDMASEREFNESNIEEFRRNGGKVGGQFEGFPLLLLTSTGAKSGAERLNLIGYRSAQGRRRQRTAARRTRPNLRHRQRARTRVRRVREAHRSRHPHLRTCHQGLINPFFDTYLSAL